ncbi:MAG: butyrate kinase [Paludibacteraceae bacterium]
MYRILSISPKSTSTKVAVYDDEQEIFMKTIKHNPDDLFPFKKIFEQAEYRKRLIIIELQNNEIEINFNAIIGMGGMLKPIRSGTYEISERLKDDLRKGIQGEHASNLGGLIAADIAATIPGARAFVSDPVVVDEMEDIARITGLPGIQRKSKFHALNQKAAGRKYAKEHQKKYDELNLVICHLGRGISVAAHRKGKVIDVNSSIDGAGPFSPERSGSLPASEIVDLCFDGNHTEEEIRAMINGNGGLMAHLGIKDYNIIEQMAKDGDKKADITLRAMAYNIAKEIGAMSVVLEGKVDAIILTGNLSYNKFIVDHIIKKTGFIATITVYPGENEMSALSENALNILKGEAYCLSYN